jgi:hypothetical protein
LSESKKGKFFLKLNFKKINNFLEFIQIFFKLQIYCYQHRSANDNIADQFHGMSGKLSQKLNIKLTSDSSFLGIFLGGGVGLLYTCVYRV